MAWTTFPSRWPRLPPAEALKPAQQPDRTLCEIAERFGASEQERVMMEMEYAGAPIGCAGNQLQARRGISAMV